MMSLQHQLKEFWRRLSLPDLFAAGMVVMGTLLLAIGKSGAVFSFVKYIALLCAGYLLVRFIGWWRSRLLWSLRNRLIVAYLFIALVPVLLTVVSAKLLYMQLGGYVLYQDIQRRIGMVDAGTEQIAVALESVPPGMSEETAEKIISAQEHAVFDKDLPGLTIEFQDHLPLLGKVANGAKREFAGLVQTQTQLFVVGLRAAKTPHGERFVHVRVPVTSAFVSSLAPDLGPVGFTLLEPLAENEASLITYQAGTTKYKIAINIFDRRRTLKPAEGFWDSDVLGVTRFEAVAEGKDGRVERSYPVLANFH